MSKNKSISMHIQNWVNSIKLSVNEMMTDGQNVGYNMPLIVAVQMGLIRFLQQWYMDPCGKTHMNCMWTHLGHYGQLITVIWSSMPENLSSEGCKHQRGRPASTSALSDQHLCCSLFVKYHS